jgi:ArsR family transcriptional regulator
MVKKKGVEPMAEELTLDEQVIDRLAAVLKALADPNRLRILAVLVQHEACNCQLNGQLGLAPNLLSHHLRVLEQAGLVRNQRGEEDARWIFYTVDRKGMKRWQGWLNQLLKPIYSQSPLFFKLEAQTLADDPSPLIIED